MNLCHLHDVVVPSCQNCEKSLEDLGVKVHDLHQEVRSTPAANELPADTISVVESLRQQHDRLVSSCTTGYCSKAVLNMEQNYITLLTLAPTFSFDSYIFVSPQI